MEAQLEKLPPSTSDCTSDCRVLPHQVRSAQKGLRAWPLYAWLQDEAQQKEKNLEKVQPVQHSCSMLQHKFRDLGGPSQTSMAAGAKGIRVIQGFRGAFGSFWVLLGAFGCLDVS